MYARATESRPSLHQVRAHSATGGRVRLSLPSRAARGAAPGSVLRPLPRLWQEGRVGPPNGARGRTQPLAARSQPVL